MKFWTLQKETSRQLFFYLKTTTFLAFQFFTQTAHDFLPFFYLHDRDPTGVDSKMI